MQAEDIGWEEQQAFIERAAEFLVECGNSGDAICDAIDDLGARWMAQVNEAGIHPALACLAAYHVLMTGVRAHVEFLQDPAPRAIGMLEAMLRERRHV